VIEEEVDTADGWGFRPEDIAANSLTSDACGIQRSPTVALPEGMSSIDQVGGAASMEDDLPVTVSEKTSSNNLEHSPRPDARRGTVHRLSVALHNIFSGDTAPRVRHSASRESHFTAYLGGIEME